jgi:predicted nucleotidyltransferase
VSIRHNDAVSTPELSPHHQAALTEAVDHFRDNPTVLAVIFGGSVSRGQGRPDSDIDLVVVVTAEEVARRTAEHDVEVVRGLAHLYEGGYFDAKIVDLAFLRDVDEHGSEPARWAFSGARLVHGRNPEIADLLERIPVYPEAHRDENVLDFLAQVMLLRWFVGEAEKRHDPYLLSYATSRLALYAGRVFLAWNRMLYPFHKWLLTEVERAPERPVDLPDLIRAAVARPGVETGEALADAVLGYRDWGLDHQHAVARFLRNTEWPWRYGPSPLEDR